jgi:hypothetical protein
MPSALCRFAIFGDGHHGLYHDVRIDPAFRQSQLPAAKLLKIKLSQTFRTTEIALSIVRDAVCGEEVAEVEPKARLRVMGVAVLEAFDIAKCLSFVKAAFNLSQANSNCRKVIGRRDLGRGPKCYAANCRASRTDQECEQLSPTHSDVS